MPDLSDCGVNWIVAGDIEGEMPTFSDTMWCKDCKNFYACKNMASSGDPRLHPLFGLFPPACEVDGTFHYAGAQFNMFMKDGKLCLRTDSGIISTQEGLDQYKECWQSVKDEYTR